MKKRTIFSLLVSILIILIAAFVSAFQFDAAYTLDNTFSLIQNNAGPIFGIFLGGNGELLFERVLLFFILLSFITAALTKIPLFKDKTGAIAIISLAVSILATRFLSTSEIIQNILTPYGVLGIVLTSAIPLVIFFFFATSFDSGVLRRILWVFFSVVFFGIWNSRQTEVGELSWVYLTTGVIALVFMVADGTIRRIMVREKMKQMNAENVEEYARKVRNQLYELEQDYTQKHSISEDFYKREKRRLEKHLKQIHKF